MKREQKYPCQPHRVITVIKYDHLFLWHFKILGILYFSMYFYYLNTSQNKHYLFSLLNTVKMTDLLSKFFLVCILEQTNNQDLQTAETLHF